MGRRSDIPTTVMASVLPCALADRIKADAKADGRNWSRQIKHIIERYYAELDRLAGEPR